MNFIIKKPFSRLLTSAIFLFLFICVSGCQKPKNQQSPLVESKTLATAQNEVNELTNLLYNPSLENIRKSWEINYAEYFLQAQQSKASQAQQFAKYAFDVARTTLNLSATPKGQLEPFKRWALLLEVRTAVHDAIKAIAVLDASTESCLENTEEEIKNIKGGCASGGCPLLKIEQVKAENEKIQMLIACTKAAFSRLQDYTGEASQIAQKGCDIMEVAEQVFSKQTNNYEQDKMKAEGGKLIEGYMQAIAMLTIALKEVYRMHPVLKSGQEVDR
jgi:hypothetical protein